MIVVPPLPNNSLRKFFALLITIFFAFNVTAQNFGDFRSKQSGEWNTPSTWETYNGTIWVNAGSAPIGSDRVSIRHLVSLSTSSASALNLIVEASGTIQIQSNRSLQVFDGPGVDMEIFGTVHLSSSGPGPLTCPEIAVRSGGAIAITATGGIFGTSLTVDAGGLIEIVPL